MNPDIVQTNTKDRLLEAAGEVFADKGFREATVRDICARAGANLAAVNYHFRDKDSLYSAAFEHARRYEQERFPIASFRGSGTPEERLAIFIRQFCIRLFDPGRPSWHVKLVAREMVEPTWELDTIVQHAIKPKMEILCGIIADMTGLDPGCEAAQLCSASIVGQCLHHHHCREVCRRVVDGWSVTDEFLETLIQHVLRFSMHALRGIGTDVAAGRMKASVGSGGAERNGEAD
ncbi:MAG: CerR family C-terminal domain-containing protein [Phycisphaerales bacterium]|nr:CerR family C-terminal domain-containing protein [Phycisphaerales bacterium]